MQLQITIVLSTGTALCLNFVLMVQDQVGFFDSQLEGTA